MKISTKEVRNVVGVLDEIIERYKKESVEKKREEIPDEFIKYLCLRNLNNVRRFF